MHLINTIPSPMLNVLLGKVWSVWKLEGSCAQAIPRLAIALAHLSFSAKYIIKSHGRHGVIHSHKV